MRRSLRWTRPLVFCHAVVPFPFQFQVRHQAQESPFEFLPAEPGIQQSASWRSELLHVPGQRPVTLLYRLEDPAAQPPYLLLLVPPVHTLPGVTIKRGQALRSVHRGVQLAHQYRHVRSLRLKGSPAHVSALAGPSIQLGIRPVIRASSGRRPGPYGTRFPAAFQPPAFAFWAPCPARELSPLYSRPTAPPAHTRACTADPDEVYTFRTRETQTGPGALSPPGTAVLIGRRGIRARRLPPLNGWSLPPRRNNPARSAYMTRHQQEFPGSRPIPVFPLTCGHPGWNGGSWAFP